MQHFLWSCFSCPSARLLPSSAFSHCYHSLATSCNCVAMSLALLRLWINPFLVPCFIQTEICIVWMYVSTFDYKTLKVSTKSLKLWTPSDQEWSRLPKNWSSKYQNSKEILRSSPWTAHLSLVSEVELVIGSHLPSDLHNSWGPDCLGGCRG